MRRGVPPRLFLCPKFCHRTPFADTLSAKDKLANILLNKEVRVKNHPKDV